MVILCGGRGARLQEHARSIPKPLVEIGGRPILWHVIRIYAAHGFRRFILLTGYRSEVIDEFAAAESWPEGVAVETVFTGDDTPTGGRIHLAGDRLSGGTFCATYADGVADIDLGEELRFHSEHGGLATMAVVRPELPIRGHGAERGRDRAGVPRRSPALSTGSTAGFFVFEPGVLDYLTPTSVLEREPLEGLAREGRLHAFRHDGLLGVHGHLEGRRDPERPVGRRRPVADLALI